MIKHTMLGNEMTNYFRDCSVNNDRPFMVAVKHLISANDTQIISLDSQSLNGATARRKIKRLGNMVATMYVGIHGDGNVHWHSHWYFLINCRLFKQTKNGLEPRCYLRNNCWTTHTSYIGCYLPPKCKESVDNKTDYDRIEQIAATIDQDEAPIIADMLLDAGCQDTDTITRLQRPLIYGRGKINQP